MNDSKSVKDAVTHPANPEPTSEQQERAGQGLPVARRADAPWEWWGQ